MIKIEDNEGSYLLNPNNIDYIEAKDSGTIGQTYWLIIHLKTGNILKLTYNNLNARNNREKVYEELYKTLKKGNE